MDLVLRRVASALALALVSSCFSPLGNGSDTEPSTGSSAAELTSGTGVTGTGEPTSEPTGEPTGEPTVAGSSTSMATGESSPGTTTTVPESCSDAEQNGDETDLDCGGSCPACEAGLGCLENGDCASMACLNEQCVGDPECLGPERCPVTACHEPLCEGFACGEVKMRDGSACDDGQVCTADEACNDGACVGSTPKPVALIDVPKDPSLGLYFDGAAGAEQAGSRVGDAGDFNGDGIRDLYVVGVGRVYVLFGGPTLANATLAGVAMGEGGVMIEVNIGSLQSWSVAAGGHLDNDEFDDLVIGARTPIGGGAFVILGRASTATIQLAPKPADVVQLAGPDEMMTAAFGTGVAGLGDVNMDEYDDFAVSAPAYGAFNVGAVFVVFGGSALADGKIQTYVTNGMAFRIEGPFGGMGFGTTVAGVGDFNKDGRNDVAVGQPKWSEDRGRAYVLYTPETPKSGQLAATPTAQEGLAVSGFTKNTDLIGRVVGGGGDFNGDGFADMVVGTGPALKRVLVVYGGNYGAEILAKDLVATKHGTVITATGIEFTDASVGGGGDVNGDGADDVVIGGPMSGMNGQVFVAFGATAVDPFDLALADLILGKGGYAIAGAGLGSETGRGVAVIPSVNDDMLADVLVGAPGFDVVANANEGRAYVVYGGACEG